MTSFTRKEDHYYCNVLQLHTHVMLLLKEKPMLKHVTNILIGFTPTERLKESKEAESSNGKLIECYSMPWKHTNGVFLSSALQIRSEERRVGKECRL